MTGDISILLDEYRALKLHEVLDHERFNEYAIVHHSSSIEGSTLTEIETRLLLEEDITPKGKLLMHSLMVKDHYAALRYVLTEAEAKKPISVDFVQRINGFVMKNTGFHEYDKVLPYTTELVKRLSANLPEVINEKNRLEFSFSAHFDLVSIHPFYDGNGRTSRLLMNYLQAYYGLPLAIVFKEDKADYYVALQETRKKEDMQVFYAFMFDQYQKHLQQEIFTYKQAIEAKPAPKKDRGKVFSLFF